MNFKELNEILLNGFHDGKLRAISVDYVARKIAMEIDFLMGDPDGESIEDRESYKAGKVTVFDFEFCVIDPPDAKYSFASTDSLLIDAGEGQPSTSIISLPAIKPDNFLFWIFVNDWNSFVRIAAKDMELEWSK